VRRKGFFSEIPLLTEAASVTADARSATEHIDHDGAVDCFFDEILESFDDGDGMIVNSLPTPLTPLQTPVHNTQYSEETVLCLHPSPNPALEESTTPMERETWFTTQEESVLFHI